MSTDNLAADRLVHVIIEQNGKRTWFNRTDRVQDHKTRRWFTVPVVDPEPSGSKPMRHDLALVAQHRWRDELNLVVRLALEPNGPYIDELPTMSLLPWKHQNYLVTVDRDGRPLDSLDAPCVYDVIATHTPSGRMFVLRFNHPDLQNQPVFSTFEEGPEVAVARAFEKGYTKLEPPQPNPYLEARRQEAARQAAEAARPKVRYRVGDLH